MRGQTGFVLSLVALSAIGASAAETRFTVGRHGMQFNSITIESNTDLETIVTTTNRISGEIRWDREAKTGSARLTVPVASLKTGIEDRDEHLQGEGWLNASDNPEISFDVTEVRHKEGDKYEVKGNFAMAGTSKPVTAEATLKYLPHKPELDKIMPNANFVKVSTAFELKLSDFGIKLPVIGLKVSDTLKVKAMMLGIDEVTKP